MKLLRALFVAAVFLPLMLLVAGPAHATGQDVVYNSSLSTYGVIAKDSQTGQTVSVYAGQNSYSKGMYDADVVTFRDVCWRIRPLGWTGWAIYGSGPKTYSISDDVQVQVQGKTSTGGCKWIG